MATAQPVDRDDAHRIKWKHGSHIRYYFFKQPKSLCLTPSERAIFKRALTRWTQLGSGLTFEETSNKKSAHIRIKAAPAAGTWSKLGSTALDETSSSQATMNFGQPLAGAAGFAAALHEIGHMLGFKHEHQSTRAALSWKSNAVKEHFALTKGWDNTLIQDEILRPHEASRITGPEWDPASIMQYELPMGMFDGQTNAVAKPMDLSVHDEKEYQHWYGDLPASKE